MDLGQALKVAFSSLLANKLRSGLTMLGMTIGVGAVITLMSIGQGAQAAVQAQFDSLGTNLVFIDPGTTSTGGVRNQAGAVNTLTYDDAKAVADPDNVPSASLVAPEVSTFGRLIYHQLNTVGRIKGVTLDYSDLHNYHVAQGDWFSDDQATGSARVVILGATVAQTLFGTTSPVGLQLHIDAGGPREGGFQIIGVAELKGGTGFDNPDTAVYVPLTTMYAKLYRAQAGSGATTVSHIALQAKDSQHLQPLQQELNDVLMARHRISDPTNLDFSVTTQEDQLATRRQVTGVLTIFLGAVAGISLVVGGIGIMNIMLVSVTERTREIGIRKAVGARRQDILVQFLVESLLVSCLGGLCGVLAGVAVAQIVNGQKLNGQALQTLVTPPSILLAVSVSAFIGLFFGIYPASRAARLTPIEALRYE
jgi:putative ABC transport system permease protein